MRVVYTGAVVSHEENGYFENIIIVIRLDLLYLIPPHDLAEIGKSLSKADVSQLVCLCWAKLLVAEVTRQNVTADHDWICLSGVAHSGYLTTLPQLNVWFEINTIRTIMGCHCLNA